jgi:hypothetical protein
MSWRKPGMRRIRFVIALIHARRLDTDNGAYRS